MKKRLKTILLSYKGKKCELIPILQRVQSEFGYLSDYAMLEIAKFIHMSGSYVYGVASFYAQFRFTPIGKKHVMVCRGTSCHVRGAPRILEKVKEHLGIKEGETTPDMEYSLETVACIGACGLSPCIMINKKVFARMTPKKVAQIFSKGGDKK